MMDLVTTPSRALMRFPAVRRIRKSKDDLGIGRSRQGRPRMERNHFWSVTVPDSFTMNSIRFYGSVDFVHRMILESSLRFAGPPGGTAAPRRTRGIVNIQLSAVEPECGERSRDTHAPVVNGSFRRNRRRPPHSRATAVHCGGHCAFGRRKRRSRIAAPPSDGSGATGRCRLSAL